MDQLKELAATTTKMEEPVQVMMKDPKKVAQGKRLVERNCRDKEKLAQVAKDQESEPMLCQAYGAGAVQSIRKALKTPKFVLSEAIYLWMKKRSEAPDRFRCVVSTSDKNDSFLRTLVLLKLKFCEFIQH